MQPLVLSHAIRSACAPFTTCKSPPFTATCAEPLVHSPCHTQVHCNFPSAPGALSPATNDLSLDYATLVDSVASPEIFCTVKNHQAYPAYIIHFSRKIRSVSECVKTCTKHCTRHCVGVRWGRGRYAVQGGAYHDDVRLATIATLRRRGCCHACVSYPCIQPTS